MTMKNYNQNSSLEPDRKRGKEACGRTQSRRQGHLRGLPPDHAGEFTQMNLPIVFVFLYIFRQFVPDDPLTPVMTSLKASGILTRYI